MIIIGIMQGMGEDRYAALGWSAIACAAFLALHLIYKPYARALFNATETMSLLVLLFIANTLIIFPLPFSTGATVGRAVRLFIWLQ